jgi:hypothetical protein
MLLDEADLPRADTLQKVGGRERGNGVGNTLVA